MVDHDFKVVDYSAKKIDYGIMVDYVIAAIPEKKEYTDLDCLPVTFLNRRAW